MLSEQIFIQLVDGLLEHLYDKEKTWRVKFPDYLKESIDERYSRQESWIIMEKVVATGLFEQWFDEGGPAMTDILYLSSAGIELINTHGTYSNYLKEKADTQNKIDEENRLAQEKENKKQEKKERAETFSNRIKNWASIATIIFGAATIVLSIFSIKQKADLGHIQSTLEQQSKKMDSILQRMSSNKPNK